MQSIVYESTIKKRVDIANTFDADMHPLRNAIVLLNMIQDEWFSKYPQQAILAPYAESIGALLNIIGNIMIDFVAYYDCVTADKDSDGVRDLLRSADNIRNAIAEDKANKQANAGGGVLIDGYFTGFRQPHFWHRPNVGGRWANPVLWLRCGKGARL